MNLSGTRPRWIGTPPQDAHNMVRDGWNSSCAASEGKGEDFELQHRTLCTIIGFEDQQVFPKLGRIDASNQLEDEFSSQGGK